MDEPPIENHAKKNQKRIFQETKKQKVEEAKKEVYNFEKENCSKNVFKFC